MNKSKVIFFSVHPDDETLGCGGTILKHKAKGDDIYWIVLTNVTEKEGWNAKRVKTRNSEIKKILSIYGFKNLIILDFTPTKLFI